MRGSTARLLRGFGCVASLVAAVAAHAQPGALIGAAEIEDRVRQIYFEGYPVDDEADLSREAIDHLGAMLSDPDEQMYWSNIVLALGASGSRHAYPYLATFAASEPSGEASSGLYSAYVALPVALGHLAHTQHSALKLLVGMARDARRDRGWRFQSLRGATLSGALRRSAITGLAVSGRDEATAVFDEIGAASDARGELSRHVESSRSLHRRAVRNGPRSVLRPAKP